MADETSSTFCEMTPNHVVFGAKKVQNDAEERRKLKEERGKGEKDYTNFCFYIGNSGDEV